MLRVTIVLLILTLLCGACGGTPVSTGRPDCQPTPTLAGQDAVSLATAELAGRLDISAAEIQLISDITVEMPLQGLGCVQAPAGTTEAAVPAQVMGHEVTISTGGREYVYRVHARQVVLCSGMGSTGAPPISRPGNSDLAIAQAVTDLAGRTRVAEKDIQVVSAESRDWPDAGLGCPEPGKMYAQVITRGFLIVLQADGKTYEYHASQSEARLCVK